MTHLAEFMRAFDVPPAMEPYIHLIATEQEIALVVALADRPMHLAEIAEAMRLGHEEAGALIAGAFQRELVERDRHNGVATYAPGKFYNTMDYLTAYQPERWAPLPGWVRNAVSAWQEAEWIRLWTPQLQEITRDPDTWVRMKNRDVLLLEESLALVEAAEHICLLRCACKTTLLPGSPVIEGSMRVGERARKTLERGQGRALSVDEAKAHLIMLDRHGLIHTGPRAWRQHDPRLEWISHGNCDPAYSFPFRAGQRLGLTKQYPRAHYEAAVDWSKCTHCGACIGRCIFRALYRDSHLAMMHGASLQQVHYNPAKCWGCGLCANACPEGAITMRPL